MNHVRISFIMLVWFFWKSIPSWSQKKKTCLSSLFSLSLCLLSLHMGNGWESVSLENNSAHLTLEAIHSSVKKWWTCLAPCLPLFLSEFCFSSLLSIPISPLPSFLLYLHLITSELRLHHTQMQSWIFWSSNWGLTIVYRMLDCCPSYLRLL